MHNRPVLFEGGSSGEFLYLQHNIFKKVTHKIANVSLVIK